MKKLLFITVIVFVFCLAAFAQADEPACPAISVTGPSSGVRIEEPMEFSVNLGKEAEKYSVEYVWSVSSGKILSGQGSKVLTVMNETGDSLTVTVVIKGLPEKCPNTMSETGATFCPPNPIKVDEIGNFGSTGQKHRVDNFLLELTNDESAEGIIVFRDDDELLKNIKYVRNYLNFRKFPLARLTIVISDKVEQLTEFWRLPKYVDLSEWNDHLIIKLEDFESLQKLFTPKTVKLKTKK
jgi:hypothetical protein